MESRGPARGRPNRDPSLQNVKLTLAQTNPALGDLHKNLAEHLREIEAAVEAGSDLIVFPELSLTGYFLRDQVYELALPLDGPELAELARASERISIAVGLVERAPDGRCYNALAWFEDGALLAVHRKVHLVTYGMFDDAREFAAGERFEPVESRLGRFGLLLCEDMWHVSSAWLYFLRNVDALIVASSGPGRGVAASSAGLESEEVWTTMLKAAALNYQTWIVYANRVGWEDGIHFAGGSSVHDPFGRRRAHLPGPETGQLAGTLDGPSLQRARFVTPLRRDAKEGLIANELAGLREHAR